MDISTLVSDLMIETGLDSDFMYTSMNPFDIARFIEGKVLRTWNNYRRWYHNVIVEFEEEDIVRTSGDLYKMGNRMYAGDITYRIPQTIRDLVANGVELFNVSDVEIYMGYNSTSMLYSNKNNVSPISLFNAPIPKMAYELSALNAAMPVVRAKFEAPDKIVMINGYNLPKKTRYQMSLGLKHTVNLKTISHGDEEPFKQLCKLELMCSLYENELKYLDGMNVGNANVELKLDAYEECRNDLKEFKEKLYNDMMIGNAKNFVKRF